MNRNTLSSLLVVALVCVANQGFAQEGTTPAPTGESESTNSALQVGLTGSLGLTTASFQNEAPEGIGYKIGFAGGLRIIYNFSEQFGIQPEFLFVQRGHASEMEMSNGAKMNHDVVLNYAQLPLLGRYNLALGDVVTAKVLAGPTFGYFVSGHQPAMEMDMATNEMKMTNKDISSDDVQTFEIGAAAGLGADFAVGPGSMSLDFRYDRGFTTVDNNDVDADDAVNTGFSLMVGYNYAL